jgi:hypothetical protein
MSGNGPSGYPARPPVRRPLADGPPTGQPQQPHWPPQQYPASPAQYGQQPAYGQQPVYGQQPGYNPPQAHPSAHGQQPAPGYYFPQGAAEQQGYTPTSGHQLPFGSPTHAPAPSYAPAAHAQTVPRRPADPQGYDLGNYMPAAAPSYAPAEADPFQQAHDPSLQQHDHDPHFGAPQQGYGETDADFDEMLAEEEEQPRRGRRGMMIAAALVGAIGLGGAMAYTYKTLVAPSGGRAPVIKAADFGPNKVKPEVPDGKVVPHTDKKLLNRLGEDGTAPPVRVVVPPTSAPAAADASDDPNGPRKVKLIPIPTPGAPPPLVAVPGVMLETGPPQGPPSAARVQLPPPAQPPAKAVQQPPVKVASAAKAPLPQAAEPAAPVTKPLVKTPVPKKTAAVDTPASAGASGYVAVLASKTSRMDALKAFADLQQKYGDVLGSKTPDVQEANLGDKGVRYRSVVGPPGSREAAAGVCKQLKIAGYADCWVTAY